MGTRNCKLDGNQRALTSMFISIMLCYVMLLCYVKYVNSISLLIKKQDQK